MASHHQPSLFGKGDFWSDDDSWRERQLDRIWEEEARYPDSPGHNFRDTSASAADAMKPKAAAIRLRLLAELQVRGGTGATCDELEQAFGMSHQTVSARLREMNLKSTIIDSGERRKTRSGRAAIVWVAKGGWR